MTNTVPADEFLRGRVEKPRASHDVSARGFR